MLRRLLFCFIVLCGSDVWAATYYVATTGNDSWPGSSTQPWRTLIKAATTMVAGDTTIVRNGIYTEDRIIFRNSGTSSAPITLRSETPRGAYLQSISGQEPAFYIMASYITIQDFRIGTSPSNVRPSGYVSKNNSVHCWAQAAPSVSNPSSGWVGCRITGNLIEQTSHRDGGMKISQDYAVIENNVIYSEVELFNNRQSILRNNIFYRGGAVGTYIVAKGGVRDSEIYNNVIHMNYSNWATGIQAGGATGDPSWFFDPNACVESYNLSIYNNVIISEATNNYGFVARSDRNSKFFNNVLIGNMVAITFQRGGVSQSPASYNPYFVNNIIKGTGSSPFTGNLTDYAGTRTIDYNNIYGYSGVPMQNNAVTGAPLFLNETSDWHVQPNSPTLNAGMTVTQTRYHGGSPIVNLDKDGRPRTSPWDLGIYGTTNVSDTTPPAPPANLRVS